MPTDKKYYRTVITLVVLTEDLIPPSMSLEDINYHTQDGEWSGDWNITDTKEVSAQEMAKLLIQQGSDPSFFSLNEDGTAIEDAEEVADAE